LLTGAQLKLLSKNGMMPILASPSVTQQVPSMIQPSGHLNETTFSNEPLKIDHGSLSVRPAFWSAKNERLLHHLGQSQGGQN